MAARLRPAGRTHAQVPFVVSRKVKCAALFIKILTTLVGEQEISTVMNGTKIKVVGDEGHSDGDLILRVSLALMALGPKALLSKNGSEFSISSGTLFNTRVTGSLPE